MTLAYVLAGWLLLSVVFLFGYVVGVSLTRASDER